MAKITQRNAAKYIEKVQPFDAGNLFAVNDKVTGERLNRIGRGNSFPDENYRYVIYSYATPIAAVTDKNVLVMPDRKYSVTTSKHQYLVRPLVGQL